MLSEVTNFFGRRVGLVICGSVAAYRSLDVVRELKKSGAEVDVVLSQGAKHFVTPTSVEALGGTMHRHLFDGSDPYLHINFSRKVDVIIVCPASANFMAKCAHGQADCLASAIVLAADKAASFFPAMNPEMWNNPATEHNTASLIKFGHDVIEPDKGEVACGEHGEGRLPSIKKIMAHIAAQLEQNEIYKSQPLKNTKSLVTVGATHEKLDPVRFIGNHSSGLQGFAIAKELTAAGSEVTLVMGKCSHKPPLVNKCIEVTSALEMYDQAIKALPVDIAVCVAAVADWRPRQFNHKIKRQNKAQTKGKTNGQEDAISNFELIENPDILRAIGHGLDEQNNQKIPRPETVIGFAAETQDLIKSAQAKLMNKKADWIMANDVSKGVFGEEITNIHKVSSNRAEDWGSIPKTSAAKQLINEIISCRQA